MEPADPDFYKIGYVRSMRAYGIEFREGPDGFGVYASKDIEPLRRARVLLLSTIIYCVAKNNKNLCAFLFNVSSYCEFETTPTFV